MSIKLFTEKEVELLSNNSYIKTISTKAITYTDEFKRIFIAESEKCKPSRVIFEEHGFKGKTWGQGCATKADECVSTQNR